MTVALLIIFVFALIGIADTIYLIYHVITKKPVACLFFPKEWCLKVQYSKYSKTFGIPNPVAGFGFYTLITTFSLFYLAGSTSFLPASAVILIGFLFSLYFTFIQGVILKAFCTWCVVSAINFTVMLVAALFVI